MESKCKIQSDLNLEAVMSKNEGTNFDLNTKSDLDIKEQYAKWLQGLEVEPTFKAKKQRKRTSKRSYVQCPTIAGSYCDRHMIICIVGPL